MNTLKLLGLLVLALVSTPSHAVMVNLKVCIQLDTDFGTAWGLAAGDEWDHNDLHDLRGVKIKLQAKTPCSATLAEFADWTGDDKGCHTFAVDPACNYDILTVSTILVDGVTVRVRYGSSEAVATIQDRVVSPNYDPPIFDSDVTIPCSSDDGYRWLAVAGHMFQKSNFGLAPTTFDIYPDLASGNPVPQDDGDIYGKHTEKFLLAHEFGHAIANRIEGHDVSFSTSCGTWDMTDGNGNSLPLENNCRAEIGGSASKSMFSMEYQAMAAREGWADFIAAWTWNDVTESNCTHGRWGATSDFDLDDDDPTLPRGWPSTPADADNDLVGAKGWVNCEGIPITPDMCAAWGASCSTPGVPLQSYITTHDWLQNVTTNTNAYGCDATSLVNRGTAGDWMRFWWDLRTDQNVSMPVIAELWDNMDMRTVDPDDDVAGGCGSTSVTDNVVWRLDVAAANTTCGGAVSNCTDEVDAESLNGQDH